MRTPISDSDRKTFAPRHDDSDLARVSDVLRYYGIANPSVGMVRDLTILVKMARVA